MILDSSVIVALALREPGYESLLLRLQEAPAVGIGAPTLAETAIVLHARLGSGAEVVLERFLRDFAVEIVTFGGDHWREAVDAFRRYGRGRHPAGLNFGDCLAYATAKVATQSLLYVGDDFAATDLGPSQ